MSTYLYDLDGNPVSFDAGSVLAILESNSYNVLKEVVILLCSFKKSFLFDKQFENLEFKCCDFSESTIYNSNFSNCKFTDCNFNFSKITNCMFGGSILSNCCFLSSTLKNCHFQHAQIDEVSWFKGCNLKGCFFYEGDFTCSFFGCSAECVDFRKSNCDSTKIYNGFTSKEGLIL